MSNENTQKSRTKESALETKPLYEKHGKWPRALSVSDLTANLYAVNMRIKDACIRVNRSPSEVRLLPVSKTMDTDHIRMAYKAGCRYLGENKIQEAWSKAQNLSDLTDLQWSIIGHLQTNKAKYVAHFASEFQALDNLRIAEALDKHLQKEGKGLDVFVQVNTSEEESKYGLAPEAVPEFIQHLAPYQTLRVKGLMTLAEFSSQPERIRMCFSRLRCLRDQLQNDTPQGANLTELSMGMSGDFEIAIEEGATVVRVGQAIFGARALPDEHYWPKEY
ncbi:YggS family pyridoxal phosphate-dependent enzyme [Citrobacter sp. Awk 2]|uniref:YggS family pyridoxal phosphate-dependent enzyme n=1 Tax=Citrobacter sp. Awk 2 TaxID=2963959 RepID=UPI002302B21A|nr:YggS family pyridoxal phosphate-dependent enzyme [Citrobacter sp. Awk 2]MDA8505120.1 YggS family pyridoxal phosphate-dependent enzyme [Citrobacter sp. Awk 2]